MLKQYGLVLLNQKLDRQVVKLNAVIQGYTRQNKMPTNHFKLL